MLLSILRIICALCLLSYIGSSLASSVDIPNLRINPTIDGAYSEQEWQGANAVDMPFITRPFEKLPAPVETQVRVFENGTDLFVLFIAKDPSPEQIRAYLRDRDAAFGADLVGIKLDPFNDGRLAYQFFVNPLGVQTDSIENEMTGQESASWNGIWSSAGQLTEEGFVVEMQIPLRLMNFEESNNIKTWGIEFVRFYPREDSYRLSHVPFDRDNACNLCQMGEATGFKDAKQTQNLAVVPTLVLGKSESRNPKVTNDFDSNTVQEVGLDINWGITPEVNLTGTLNPDFSQVESDDAQLNINNNFALFVDERRPFFVENADYFSSIRNLVYTRFINAPDYGAKVTGRVDNHSLGVFVANDQSTQFLIPGNLGSEIAIINEKSTNFAGRYRYDYSDDLSVGLLSTARQSDSYENVVTGVDTRYRLSQSDIIRAQVVVSQTQYPEFLQQQFCRQGDCSLSQNQSESALRTAETDKFSGKAYSLYYDRDTDNYYINARRTVTESDFRADLGFISNVDRKRYIFGGGYFWRNDNAWWNQVRINGDWDITHNDNGELIEKELEGYASISAAYQTYVEVGFVKRDRVGLREQRGSLAISGNTTLFAEDSYSLYFETAPFSTWEYSAFTRIGDRIDFVNNRLGDSTYFEQGVSLNIGRHIRMDIDHTHSKLDSTNMSLFKADLVDLRTTYQFDPQQYMRLIVTYSNVRRNPNNYPFEVNAKQKDYGLQLLYSYKLNPLTKFFVGVSQSAVQDDELATFEVNNRSVFMKFSYAWLP